MDNSTEKSDRVAALEEKQRVIETWLKNPVTQTILDDLAEQQESFLNMILENPITDVETFFIHFTACGHLRGLRRFKTISELQLEEVKLELKQENE